MSFWIYRKDKSGKKSLYSIDFPYESLIILIILLCGLFASRYIYDKTKFAYDSIGLLIVGFVFLLIAKISLFRKGIWNSWGSSLMSTPFKYLYWTGYILMILGIVLGAVFMKTST